MEDLSRREKIVVSSNCQTGGVAAALACLLPGWEVVPVHLPSASDAASVAKFEQEHLASADAWVTSRNYVKEDGRAARSNRVLTIPAISRFDAFHPDVVYVRSKKTNELTSYHYNSAIVAWCYRNHVGTAETAGLFRSAVFEAIGYFERWTPSVQALRESCAGTDVDFERFYLRARRERPFMHSVNHPTARCLFVLAESIATRLGGSPELAASPPTIPDGLAGAAWPVYPEIAERLGMAGQYSWLIKGNRVTGVRQFVETMYQRYAAEGFAPEDIAIVGERPELEAVLAQAVGGGQ